MVFTNQNQGINKLCKACQHTLVENSDRENVLYLQNNLLCGSLYYNTTIFRKQKISPLLSEISQTFCNNNYNMITSHIFFITNIIFMFIELNLDYQTTRFPFPCDQIIPHWFCTLWYAQPPPVVATIYTPVGCRVLSGQHGAWGWKFFFDTSLC